MIRICILLRKYPDGENKCRELTVEHLGRRTLKTLYVPCLMSRYEIRRRTMLQAKGKEKTWQFYLWSETGCEPLLQRRTDDFSPDWRQSAFWTRKPSPTRQYGGLVMTLIRKSKTTEQTLRNDIHVRKLRDSLRLYSIIGLNKGRDRSYWGKIAKPVMLLSNQKTPVSTDISLLE